MKKNILLSLAFIMVLPLYSQEPIPSTAKNRRESYKLRLEMKENSLVRDLEFRNAGPVNMSGRVVDFDVNPEDPTDFFVAYASGGLFRTQNNGISFEPLFDNQEVMTIGDIAVDWKSGTIWVGTGENNSSRSSYSGTGIFKSTDWGKNWKHTGLQDSHHTGRIIIHPVNPNIVWVAALGHLYSPNEERGIYKTTDGGESWKKTLYIDENTGFIDLAIDPQNQDILYAAAWERERKAWNFTESGNGSGIYKSFDGGENWQKISGGNSGFPEGEGIGRIGLAIYPKNPKIIFAYLDNQFHQEKKETKKKDGLTKEALKEMSAESFLNYDDKQIAGFLRKNSFPEKYTAERVKEMIRLGDIKPSSLAEYLTDENSLLFETPVIGAELYRSEDGGKSWKKTHEKPLNDLVYTYGYYFGEVRVSHRDPEKIYLLGVPLIYSEDGGKSFHSLGDENVHADHQALWVNPERDGHLIDGNDGGVNISYDNGKTWYKANVPAVGQFYSVNFDKETPYNVYGGLQDNGVWYGPSVYNPENSWHQRGRDDYKPIGGGDGMQVEVDWRDNHTVYSGSQFGYYYRFNTKTGERLTIKPKHNLGEKPLRFNWETPIYLSRHNQDILYYGANRLYRSMDKGENLIAISPDLTNGGKKGDVSYGTLTSINESILKFGLIYTGSDDGAVYVTKDGGVSWKNISAGLPEKMWISQVFASQHKESRVYVSLNGYRWDHFKPYIFVSEDYGESWTQIGTMLPEEAVNVIKEDPEKEDILYAGTDHGAYLSLDRGKTFMAFSKGLPDVPVHDLALHPDEKELILATHGRSIYIADISGVQQLPDIKDKEVFLFKPGVVNSSPYWGKSWNSFIKAYEPETRFSFYVKNKGRLKFNIYTDDGSLIQSYNLEAEKGIQSFDYDLSLSEKLLKKASIADKKPDILKASDNGKIYIPKGKYSIEIEKEGITYSEELLIK